MAAKPAALVVGATGVLRPAVLDLVGGGTEVIGLARDRGRLAALATACGPGFRPLAVDYTDDAALAGALAEVPAPGFSAALLYCPGAPATAVRLLAERVSGRVVCLLTSSWARPGRRRPAYGVSCVELLLGWAREAAGTRWHTPAEISRAALDVLASGRPGTLGTVRPWRDRPR